MDRKQSDRSLLQGIAGKEMEKLNALGQAQLPGNYEFKPAVGRRSSSLKSSSAASAAASSSSSSSRNQAAAADATLQPPPVPKRSSSINEEPELVDNGRLVDMQAVTKSRHLFEPGNNSGSAGVGTRNFLRKPPTSTAAASSSSSSSSSSKAVAASGGAVAVAPSIPRRTASAAANQRSRQFPPPAIPPPRKHQLSRAPPPHASGARTGTGTPGSTACSTIDVAFLNAVPEQGRLPLAKVAAALIRTFPNIDIAKCTQIWKSAKTPGSKHKKEMDIDEFTRAWKLCTGELQPQPRKRRETSNAPTTSGGGKWAREGSVSMQAALARKAVSSGAKDKFEATAEENEINSTGGGGGGRHAPSIVPRRQQLAVAPTNNNAAMLETDKSASLNRRSRLTEAEELAGAAAAFSSAGGSGAMIAEAGASRAGELVGRQSSDSYDAAVNAARVSASDTLSYNYKSDDDNSDSGGDDDDDDYQTRSAALERKARLMEAEALSARRAANKHAATRDANAASGSGWAREGSVSLQAARKRGTLTISGLHKFAESSTDADDGYNGDNDYDDKERAFQIQKVEDRRAAAAAAQARADVEAIEQVEAEAAVRRAATEADAAVTAQAQAAADLAQKKREQMEAAMAELAAAEAAAAKAAAAAEAKRAAIWEDEARLERAAQDAAAEATAIATAERKARRRSDEVEASRFNSLGQSAVLEKARARKQGEEVAVEVESQTQTATVAAEARAREQAHEREEREAAKAQAAAAEAAAARAREQTKADEQAAASAAAAAAAAEAAKEEEEERQRNQREAQAEAEAEAAAAAAAERTRLDGEIAAPASSPVAGAAADIREAKRMWHGSAEDNQLTMYKGDSFTIHKEEGDFAWATRNDDGTTTGWVKLKFLTAPSTPPPPLPPPPSTTTITMVGGGEEEIEEAMLEEMPSPDDLDMDDYHDNLVADNNVVNTAAVESPYGVDEALNDELEDYSDTSHPPQQPAAAAAAAETPYGVDETLNAAVRREEGVPSFNPFAAEAAKEEETEEERQQNERRAEAKAAARAADSGSRDGEVGRMASDEPDYDPHTMLHLLAARGRLKASNETAAPNAEEDVARTTAVFGNIVLGGLGLSKECADIIGQSQSQSPPPAIATPAKPVRSSKAPPKSKREAQALLLANAMATQGGHSIGASRQEEERAKLLAKQVAEQKRAAARAARHEHDRAQLLAAALAQKGRSVASMEKLKPEPVQAVASTDRTMYRGIAPVAQSIAPVTAKPAGGALTEAAAAQPPPSSRSSSSSNGIVPGSQYEAKRMCHGLPEENELTIYKGDIVTVHRVEGARVWATHNDDETTGWVKLSFLKPMNGGGDASTMGSTATVQAPVPVAVVPAATDSAATAMPGMNANATAAKDDEVIQLVDEDGYKGCDPATDPTAGSEDEPDIDDWPTCAASTVTSRAAGGGFTEVQPPQLPPSVTSVLEPSPSAGTENDAERYQWSSDEDALDGDDDGIYDSATLPSTMTNAGSRSVGRLSSDPYDPRTTLGQPLPQNFSATTASVRATGQKTFVFKYYKLPEGEEVMSVTSDDCHFLAWNEKYPDVTTGGKKVKPGEIDKRLLIWAALKTAKLAGSATKCWQGLGAKSLFDKNGNSWVQSVTLIGQGSTLVYDGRFEVGGVVLPKDEVSRAQWLLPAVPPPSADGGGCDGAESDGSDYDNLGRGSGAGVLDGPASFDFDYDVTPSTASSATTAGAVANQLVDEDEYDQEDVHGVGAAAAARAGMVLHDEDEYDDENVHLVDEDEYDPRTIAPSSSGGTVGVGSPLQKPVREDPAANLGRPVISVHTGRGNNPGDPKRQALAFKKGARLSVLEFNPPRLAWARLDTGKEGWVPVQFLNPPPTKQQMQQQQQHRSQNPPNAQHHQRQQQQQRQQQLQQQQQQLQQQQQQLRQQLQQQQMRAPATRGAAAPSAHPAGGAFTAAAVPRHPPQQQMRGRAQTGMEIGSRPRAALPLGANQATAATQRRRSSTETVPIGGARGGGGGGRNAPLPPPPGMVTASAAWGSVPQRGRAGTDVAQMPRRTSGQGGGGGGASGRAPGSPQLPANRNSPTQARRRSGTDVAQLPRRSSAQRAGGGGGGGRVPVICNWPASSGSGVCLTPPHKDGIHCKKHTCQGAGCYAGTSSRVALCSACQIGKGPGLPKPMKASGYHP